MNILRFPAWKVFLIIFAFLLSGSRVFAQVDWNPSTGSYTDVPYWNDYSSNVWKPIIPATGNSPSSGTGGGSKGGVSSGSSASGTAPRCKNINLMTQLKEPSGAFGVKANKDGKIFYLGGNEEVKNVRLDQNDHKIYAEKNSDTAEVGAITVFDPERCSYPEYGYLYTKKLKTFLTGGSVAGAPLPPADSSKPADLTVPEDKTAVNINRETGKIYDACTKKLIPEARFDAFANKIFFKDTDSNFGALLGDTYGYVNMDSHKAPP